MLYMLCVLYMGSKIMLSMSCIQLLILGSTNSLKISPHPTSQIFRSHPAQGINLVATKMPTNVSVQGSCGTIGVKELGLS